MAIALNRVPLPVIRSKTGSYRYQMTTDDLLMLGRALNGEEGPEGAPRLAWVYAQRWFLIRSASSSFGEMVSRHSHVTSPLWSPDSENCRPGGRYHGRPECDHPERREAARNRPWSSLRSALQDNLYQWASGNIPNPVPRGIDFAADDLVRRKIANGTYPDWTIIYSAPRANTVVSDATSRAWSAPDLVQLEVNGRTVGVDTTVPPATLVYLNTQVGPTGAYGAGVPFVAPDPAVTDSSQLTFALLGNAFVSQTSGLLRPLRIALSTMLDMQASVDTFYGQAPIAAWLETAEVARSRQNRSARAASTAAIAEASTRKVVLVSMLGSDNTASDMTTSQIQAMDTALKANGAAVYWLSHRPRNPNTTSRQAVSPVVTNGPAPRQAAQTIRSMLDMGIPLASADIHVATRARLDAAGVHVIDSGIEPVSLSFWTNPNTYSRSGGQNAASVFANLVVQDLHDRALEAEIVSVTTADWAQAKPPEECPPDRQRPNPNAGRNIPAVPASIDVTPPPSASDQVLRDFVMLGASFTAPLANVLRPIVGATSYGISARPMRTVQRRGEAVEGWYDYAKRRHRNDLKAPMLIIEMGGNGPPSVENVLIVDRDLRAAGVTWLKWVLPCEWPASWPLSNQRHFETVKANRLTAKSNLVSSGVETVAHDFAPAADEIDEDGTHLTRAGYTRFAHAILRTLGVE